MKNVLLYLLSLFIVSIIVIAGCEKEILPTITITNIDGNLNVYIRDTVKIEYSVNEANLESVGLIVDNVTLDSQSDPMYYFNFIPDSNDYYTIELKAHYSSGRDILSNRIYVFANPLYNLPLRLNCSRIDGNPHYFVGESVLIEVEPKYTWVEIYNAKKMTFSLNDDILGVHTSPPFVFETPEIQESENEVFIELIDSANHIHYIDMTLYVPINTPPEIELKFKPSNVLKSGYYFTTDSVILEIMGSDNIYVDYVDFYFENEYIATDSVKSEWFFGRKLNLGLLTAGYHNMHCIAYDDRGVASYSDTLYCIVFTAFDINEDILDIENTNQLDLAYLLSLSHLFRINPQTEELTEIIDLPFPEATAMDYVNDEQRLYIGFKNGQLAYWDESLQDFYSIETEEISNIEDIEVDHQSNMSYLISDLNVISLHLSTNSIIEANVTLPTESTLFFDPESNYIVVGGEDSKTFNWVYKLKLENNLIICEDSTEIGNNARKLILKPNHSEFLLQDKNTSLGNYVVDILEFGEPLGMFEMNHPKYATFNSDGSILFLGNNSYNEIFVYNTNNYTKIDSYYIPLYTYNNVEFMITDVDNSKLIITTDNVFYDDVKLIFYRLE